MNLKLCDKFTQNYRIQLNSSDPEDKNKLNEINKKTEEINELNDFSNVDFNVRNTGYNNFINM